MPELTLYFDGLCPFCVGSMRRLMAWDRAGRLAFVDIAGPGFDPAPLGVDMAALNREVHGLTRGGKVLASIDTMLAASYRWFARHRYAISKCLGLRLPPGCDGEVCGIGNPFLKR